MQRSRVFGSAFVRGLLILLGGVALLLALALYLDSNRLTPTAASRRPPATDRSETESAPSKAPLSGQTTQERTAGEAIIVDHTSTDINAIPQAWIEKAKEDLHIGYGHTSHGGQLTGGMAGLIDFANGGGLGLSLPTDIFQFSPDGNHGGDYLHLFEGPGTRPGYLEGDCGSYPGWVFETREYLGDPDPATGRGTDRPEINVIIWSWCGQPRRYTEQKMYDEYLLPMSQLEEEYPGVTFVYMTAHSDGTGESGTMHQRNQQIRNYCIQNDKVLYDFYDIELYDPDGNYYGDKAVDGECNYDSNGDGTQDSIWCLEWQGSHTEDVDWFYAECPHSYSINCNQKAYAAWWLWARLAGWDGGGQAAEADLTPSSKTAHPQRGDSGDQIAYTIVLRNSNGPLGETVSLSDTVPDGLVYQAGSLTSTAGQVSDAAAPTLSWSGTLSPTPVVTITYAATVDTMDSAFISNNAVIDSPTSDPIARTATILINPYRVYIPILLRDG